MVHNDKQLEHAFYDDHGRIWNGQYERNEHKPMAHHAVLLHLYCSCLLCAVQHATCYRHGGLYGISSRTDALAECEILSFVVLQICQERAGSSTVKVSFELEMICNFKEYIDLACQRDQVQIDDEALLRFLNMYAHLLARLQSYTHKQTSCTCMCTSMHAPLQVPSEAVLHSQRFKRGARSMDEGVEDSEGPPPNFGVSDRQEAARL